VRERPSSDRARTSCLRTGCEPSLNSGASDVEVRPRSGGYYGGTDTGNLGGIEAEPIPWSQQTFSAEITLPPMGVLWLVPEEKPKP